MKRAAKFIVVLLVFVLCTCCLPKSVEAGHAVIDVQEDWRLGVQLWTFNRFTFYDAVDKVAALGLSYIEAYPGQRLSKESLSAKFHYTMPADIRKEVKQKLAQAGVKLLSYGVVKLPKDKAECRKLFDFAKDMGIETIVMEPPENAFDLIDSLCREYKIKVAIHNHPKPTQYWNPDKVLAVCKGRSKWIGACADTGHWVRSGINPIEALKKLEGRIIELHLKDLNKFGERRAHDVVWGTGKTDVKAILAELVRQDFKGTFLVEYEYNWKNSMPDIAECIRYFDDVASELGRSRWRWLFNGTDLTGWIAKPNSWVVEDGGVLSAKGGGNIWTEQQFGDFILDLEFKLAKGSNSGVFIRTGDIDDFVQTAIEIQILDSYGKVKPGKQDCGAIFDCLKPSENMVKDSGEWNRYIITCKANRINVVLNGEQIIDMDLNLWTEAHKNPDGTPNKFNTAYKDMPRVGRIGLQYHGDPVWYRNIRIKALDR